MLQVQKAIKRHRWGISSLQQSKVVRVPAPSDLQAAGAAEDAEIADEWEEDAEDEAAEDQGSTLPSSAENADEQAGPSPRTLQQVSCCPAFAGIPSELHSPLMCWGRHHVPCLSCLRLPSSVPARLDAWSCLCATVLS